MTNVIIARAIEKRRTSVRMSRRKNASIPRYEPNSTTIARTGGMTLNQTMTASATTRSPTLKAAQASARRRRCASTGGSGSDAWRRCDRGSSR